MRGQLLQRSSLLPVISLSADWVPSASRRASTDASGSENDAIPTYDRLESAADEATERSAAWVPKGKVTSTLGHRTDNAAEKGSLLLGSLFPYADRLFDPDTGLQANLNRWYDASVGRWISDDPIGLFGGVNLYRYCDDSPATCSDPIGLDPVTVPGGKSVEDAINTEIKPILTKLGQLQEDNTVPFGFFTSPGGIAGLTGPKAPGIVSIVSLADLDQLIRKIKSTGESVGKQTPGCKSELRIIEIHGHTLATEDSIQIGSSKKPNAYLDLDTVDRVAAQLRPFLGKDSVIILAGCNTGVAKNLDASVPQRLAKGTGAKVIATMGFAAGSLMGRALGRGNEFSVRARYSVNGSQVYSLYEEVAYNTMVDAMKAATLFKKQGDKNGYDSVSEAELLKDNTSFTTIAKAMRDWLQKNHPETLKVADRDFDAFAEKYYDSQDNALRLFPAAAK